MFTAASHTLSKTKQGGKCVCLRKGGDWCSLLVCKTFSSVHTDNGCSQCHCERVVCVVCLCLSVLEAPSVSLRHVRNAAGEAGGMRGRKEGGKGQEDGIFRTRWFGVTWLVSMFITCCPS